MNRRTAPLTSNYERDTIPFCPKTGNNQSDPFVTCRTSFVTKPAARFVQNRNRYASHHFELDQYARISCQGERFMGSPDAAEQIKLRKPYDKPTTTKLTQEEAKCKLIDYASRGDEGAKAILEVMFPEEAKKLLTITKKKPA